MTTAPLELLAPARDADIGIEAVRHGADAVYIGGPAFGARHGAGNSVAEIERLARFAHRFHAKVFVALNTIFTDAEIEQVAPLTHQLYAAGVDALIVQDMGLLACDLPPIQLHASTQCDIRTPEKAVFLAEAGFSQLVLARELSIAQVQAVHAALAARFSNYSHGDTAPQARRGRAGRQGAITTAIPPTTFHEEGGDHGAPPGCAAGAWQVGDLPPNYSRGGTAPLLEYFIHGALCVAYSGQCYISHAHTGRSANRGECSQACRLPYNLEDAKGRVVAFDQHLLSMKDNDQSANLAALADAGIRSFKIEGRLKDMAYVKNATAHYRQLLDALIEARAHGTESAAPYARASSGRVRHFFVPQPEKTFNRGATDYFANGRHADIAAFETPKFAGEAIGEITRVGPDWFEIATTVDLHNGDGVSYLAARRSAGMRINTVQRIAGGARLTPNAMPDNPAELRPGLTIYRNRDQAFERQLEKPSAERRIGIALRLTGNDAGLTLHATDADGITAQAHVAVPLDLAHDAAAAGARLAEQLGKTGGTDYVAERVDIDLSPPRFVPAAVANALRRDVLAALDAARAEARPRLVRATPVEPPTPYPDAALSYLANVLNSKARAFYQRHGVSVIADAYEADTTPGDVSLMITKHCLRYTFSQCPKEAKGWVKGVNAEPMTLVNGNERLTLRFDCKACEMHVVGRLRKHRTVPIHVVASH